MYQEFDNALKVFLECFPLVESAISAPETARRIRCSQDVYGTVIGVLGLKMATNGHFQSSQSLLLQGVKISTLKIRLNKSLVLSSQDQGVKLA